MRSRGDGSTAWLNRLFGRPPDARSSDEPALETAVSSLAALYDDSEVKSERGLSVAGPRAEEVRGVGRRLFKTGGKLSMLAACDALREPYGWAIANLEAISGQSASVAKLVRRRCFTAVALQTTRVMRTLADVDAYGDHVPRPTRRRMM